jgi:hypothetical protein
MPVYLGWVKFPWLPRNVGVSLPVNRYSVSILVDIILASPVALRAVSPILGASTTRRADVARAVLYF